MFVSVSALPTELFDVRTKNLEEACTLTMSQTAAKVNVKGQSHQVKKKHDSGRDLCRINLSYDVTLGDFMT